MKKFENKFGKPTDTLVVIGDWSELQYRKFHEPTKGVGLRKTFRRYKYDVFLADEFRTSKMCAYCSQEGACCENFRWVNNPRPYRNGIILRHGLIKCRTC